LESITLFLKEAPGVYEMWGLIRRKIEADWRWWICSYSRSRYLKKEIQGNSALNLCHEKLNKEGMYGWWKGFPTCGRIPSRNWRSTVPERQEKEIIWILPFSRYSHPSKKRCSIAKYFNHAVIGIISNVNENNPIDKIKKCKNNIICLSCPIKVIEQHNRQGMIQIPFNISCNHSPVARWLRSNRIEALHNYLNPQQPCRWIFITHLMPKP